MPHSLYSRGIRHVLAGLTVLLGLPVFPRRPSYSAFVDPGLDLTLGSNTFTLNVPVRAYADRRANLYDRVGQVQGGGNLAKWQVLAGHTHRF